MTSQNQPVDQNGLGRAPGPESAPLLPESVKRVKVKYVPASFRKIMSAKVNTTSPGLYVQGLLIHGDIDDVIRLAGERLTVQYRIDADGRNATMRVADELAARRQEQLGQPAVGLQSTNYTNCTNCTKKLSAVSFQLSDFRFEI